MPDDWPNENADYEFVGGDAEALATWTSAINGALEAERLVLTYQWGDLYHLRGSCPRCGHRLGQVVTFSAIVPGGGGAGDELMHQAYRLEPRGVEWVDVDVVCSCSEDTHPGRAKEQSGCGWGKGLRMRLHRPAG